MDHASNERTSVSEIALRSTMSVPCEGNSPVALDDDHCFWYVENGAVDLFLVETKEGVEQAAPQHLMRVESKRLLPSVVADKQDREESETTLGLVAKGKPGTRLTRIPVADLAKIHTYEIAAQIDGWLSALTQALSRFVIRSPRPNALLEPTEEITLSAGTVSVSRSLVWVSGATQGTGLFMDMVDPAEIVKEVAETAIPLTRASWISIFEEVTISGYSTETLASDGTLLDALASFHRIALHMERLNRRLAVVDDANLERDRIMSRRVAEDVARTRLFNIYDQQKTTPTEADDTALASALRLIGRRLGIEFKIPQKSESFEEPVTLIDILDVSSVRARRVSLDSEQKWWRSDSAVLLAFRATDNQPIVLIPGMHGRYNQIDPITKKRTITSKTRAEELKEDAWMFYQPLPSGSVTAAELLRFSLRRSGKDLARLVISGIVGGLVKLIPALMLGLVANYIVAGGNTTGPLFVVAVLLVVVGLLSVLVNLLQNTAMMRFEGRSASRLEAALWDRLMRLPSEVLHRQPSGELAMSGMAFQNLRDGLQRVVANSVLSLIFLLPVFGVVFFYDVVLGSVVLIFSLVALSIMFFWGMCQVSPYGRMIGAIRRVSGLLFEIIEGISKLRVENAEGSAFAMWAQDYREQKRAELKLGKYERHARALGAALPFLAGAVLVFVVVTIGNGDFLVGDFLIAFAVFIVFQHAIARFGESFGLVASMLPAMKQMRSMLAADPHTKMLGEPVDSLQGDVLFDRISFRYTPEGPLVLSDVTIHARPGEFIAIAGESGAGKSTLFRLAIGLDRPTNGAVYYDGRDLRHLNLKQLRRKMGVVPQSVRLHPQDIWDNIVVHHEDPNTEQVWEAVRSASIEQEIRSMPMGMMTMVGASGSVLSGGESQRISIARSLLGNPRIMLFDEATNWLDNDKQAHVMQNLALLTSTRIVIAHRLSTLKQADRIFVMQAGKVVQSGTFDELMEVQGVFKELVKRQIA
ncbi:MAG: ATP-binding cassette domain-containing protein [Gammaproteobacteria bacterium]|nr:ATP-binding cassette domain-containing protein [Gammaproteobacteria bacterium]